MTSSFENYHTKRFFLSTVVNKHFALQMSNCQIFIYYIYPFVPLYTQYEYINDTGNYTKDLNCYIPTVTIYGYLMLL